jgi:hypothetical protein
MDEVGEPCHSMENGERPERTRKNLIPSKIRVSSNHNFWQINKKTY